jgi:hypothetical protein
MKKLSRAPGSIWTRKEADATRVSMFRHDALRDA